MRQEWVLNVRRQCEQQKVAFFFKQWGGWTKADEEAQRAAA